MKRRIVFAGDSIIHGGPWQYWLPKHYVTNFAFPGHTTSDMSDLMADIVKSQPELLIVMIGTNDFGKYRLPEDQVIKNILANVESVHSLIPGIPIIWSSLTPRSDEFSQSMIVVNSAIRPVIESLGMIYLDVFTLLRDEKVNTLKLEYCEDPDTFGLHLTNKGYEEWFKAMSPIIERELAASGSA
jgi:lysophospholipase L1-like esterase